MKLTPRQLANKAGQKTYIGKPCTHGHGNERYSNTNQCIICYQSTRRKAATNALKTKYNISAAEYTTMLIDQQYQCKICLLQLSSDPFHKDAPMVDHCHTTGKVRGLLCRMCNTGLGRFKDNVEYLLRAIEYLKDSVDNSNKL